MKNELVKKIRHDLISSGKIANFSDEQLLSEIEKLVNIELVDKNIYLDLNGRNDIIERVYGSIRGFGILDVIMKDDSITEVMINGHEEIFVEKEGKVIKIDESFESEERLADIIQKIVGQTGREVNQANPIVDTRLPDGSRVNVVLSPISLNGHAVTIRKFSKKPMTIERLLGYNAITQEAADFLRKLVQSKYNIIVSGGTGSGKTTFLNAISNFIPRDERIITIEDSAELQITEVDNLISLETRNSNSAGMGRISIRDLIKSSLRMRPERIIVGEVRGEEAIDMLQAMNTGHDGSLSTAHANTAYDMLSRLEVMILLGSENLPLNAIRKQIASSVDIIVQLSRLRDGSRKVVEICEILDVVDGEIQLNSLFKFEEDETQSNLHKVVGTLVRKNKLVDSRKLVLRGLKEDAI